MAEPNAIFKRNEVYDALKSCVADITLWNKETNFQRILRGTLDPQHIPPHITTQLIYEFHDKPEFADTIVVWDVRNNKMQGFKIEEVRYVQYLDAY